MHFNGGRTVLLGDKSHPVPSWRDPSWPPSAHPSPPLSDALPSRFFLLLSLSYSFSIGCLHSRGLLQLGDKMLPWKQSPFDARSLWDCSVCSRVLLVIFMNSTKLQQARSQRAEWPGRRREKGRRAPRRHRSLRWVCRCGAARLRGEPRLQGALLGLGTVAEPNPDS